MAEALVYIEGKPELVDENSVYSYIDSNKVHRPSEDGPALCWPNGTEEYYEHGKLHRLDGPAIVKYNGDMTWYFNGKRHREDGPAVTKLNGFKMWYVNNKIHRIDGPAVIYQHGSKEWWLFNTQYTEEEWIKEREKYT